MKVILKPFWGVFVALVAVLMFSSCDDEEARMERNLIEQQTWQGWLPYDGYSHNDYYSIISFYPDGTGEQSIYRNNNNRPSLVREFDWRWSNYDYAVLILDFYYTGEVACIDVIDISLRRLTGYYYEDYEEFIYNKENYRHTEREDKYISFRPR